MSYLGVGLSPANIPVNQAMELNTVDRRVRLTELVLRCAICGLAILSAILITTAHQMEEVFTIKTSAKYTQMKSLTFLVTANGIAAAYLLLQASRCIFNMVKGQVLFSRPLAWFIFSGDQLVAYLTAAAAAAAAESAALAKFGQPELQWLKLCEVFGKYCNRIGEGIACGLLVCFGMVAISAISAFNLFRLYGGKKSVTW
ncbi:unnamed protein product [Rhodiola kirilowii]